MRKLRKFLNTLRIAGRIIMARTFGEYWHSGWDETGEYALYRWRGGVLRVPTIPPKSDF